MWIGSEGERQKEILIGGVQGTLFVFRAEVTWDETEFDLCNPTMSNTTASYLKRKKKKKSLLLVGPLPRQEADTITSSTSLDLARHQWFLASHKWIILQGWLFCSQSSVYLLSTYCVSLHIPYYTGWMAIQSQCLAHSRGDWNGCQLTAFILWAQQGSGTESKKHLRLLCLVLLSLTEENIFIHPVRTPSLRVFTFILPLHTLVLQSRLRIWGLLV